MNATFAGHVQLQTKIEEMSRWIIEVPGGIKDQEGVVFGRSILASLVILSYLRKNVPVKSS